MKATKPMRQKQHNTKLAQTHIDTSKLHRLTTLTITNNTTQLTKPDNLAPPSLQLNHITPHQCWLLQSWHLAFHIARPDMTQVQDQMNTNTYIPHTTFRYHISKRDNSTNTRSYKATIHAHHAPSSEHRSGTFTLHRQ